MSLKVFFCIKYNKLKLTHRGYTISLSSPPPQAAVAGAPDGAVRRVSAVEEHRATQLQCQTQFTKKADEQAMSKRAGELSESRRSLSLMDIRDSRGVTSVLPAYWREIGYLTGGLVKGGRGSGLPELSLAGRKAAVEAATSRPNSDIVCYFSGLAVPLSCYSIALP
ncbi:hypothetical protein EVAR_10058_1 [Eumeta japonica]|uniref:Uncharacterized protein n=1 Tax=Eumeta variegata TaxID=151549 RepID=A0A4C1TR71_EUMVA|nr:hypothetical protein EVAR_10058_1 [Eumeta japonica]